MTRTDGLSELAWARWSAADGAPPALPGFVASDFAPSISDVADRVLSGGQASARTGLVLASSGGDLATAVATAEAVDAGKAPGALLFFQSVPNAVLGHIAKRWSLTGPVICLSPDSREQGEVEARSVARLLLRAGEADMVLMLLAEPGSAVAVLLEGDAS
ncbi:MAG TPA: hypothetical protein VL551_04720 [Actinospica sp.]|jgi:hypothetical protein|nr:hypothetical protein [Actinospica sp.]